MDAIKHWIDTHEAPSKFGLPNRKGRKLSDKASHDKSTIILRNEYFDTSSDSGEFKPQSYNVPPFKSVYSKSSDSVDTTAYIKQNRMRNGFRRVFHRKKNLNKLSKLSSEDNTKENKSVSPAKSQQLLNTAATNKTNYKTKTAQIENKKNHVHNSSYTPSKKQSKKPVDKIATSNNLSNKHRQIDQQNETTPNTRPFKHKVRLYKNKIVWGTCEASSDEICNSKANEQISSFSEEINSTSSSEDTDLFVSILDKHSKSKTPFNRSKLKYSASSKVIQSYDQTESSSDEFDLICSFNSPLVNNGITKLKISEKITKNDKSPFQKQNKSIIPKRITSDDSLNISFDQSKNEIRKRDDSKPIETNITNASDVPIGLINGEDFSKNVSEKIQEVELSETDVHSKSVSMNNFSEQSSSSFIPSTSIDSSSRKSVHSIEFSNKITDRIQINDIQQAERMDNLPEQSDSMISLITVSSDKQSNNSLSSSETDILVHSPSKNKKINIQHFHTPHNDGMDKQPPGSNHINCNYLPLDEFAVDIVEYYGSISSQGHDDTNILKTIEDVHDIHFDLLTPDKPNIKVTLFPDNTRKISILTLADVLEYQKNNSIKR